MIELYFITSNPVKLAHFSHIGRRLGLRIIGFRQRTYYGSYSEPDSSDREEVLSASYKSALKKWKRAGLPPDAMFFFEDTSVRIDALSEGEGDFPGTRVKFWMRETKFANLDAQLQSRPRAAAIRSDLVLHVPDVVKKYLGYEMDYFHCSGEVVGRVAKKPSSNRLPNVLYPWLDPNTFSGWFIPKGASGILSDLNIQDADKYDFRSKSCESMTAFLERLRVGSPSYGPRPLQAAFDFIVPRKVVVVLGQTCAGKTTAARELCKDGGAIHLEASDFMRAEFARRHGALSKLSIREFAAEALKSEPWIVPRQMLEIIQRFSSASFVISGFRSPSEIDILMEDLHGESVTYIWVKSSQTIRFARSQARGRPGGAVDLASFRAEDSAQLEMGLKALRRRRELIHVINEGALGDYLEEMTLVCDVGALESRAENDQALKDMLGVLQWRLIIALGRMGGANEYFTSGQVARFTADSGEDLMTTQKDNISRFFTQANYPFFEMRKRHAGSEIKLSNSGVSLFQHLDRLEVLTRKKKG